MENIFGTLFLASLILLVIGFFSPKASLFWYNKDKTRKISSLIYSISLIIFFILFSMVTDKKDKKLTEQPSQIIKENIAKEKDTLKKQITPEEVEKQKQVEIQKLKKDIENENEKQKDQVIFAKLKAQARKDWPNDYVTQEYWVNEQIEAYYYMKSIQLDAIKRQAQRDWPLDYVTQKYWYNEQIEAKERMK